MSITARTLLACALIGAGLIHLALVIAAPLGLTVALGALGFLEFGWGALTIAEPRVRAPRLAFAVALTPVAAWGAALVVSGPFGSTELARTLPLVPLAIAAVLELAAAAVLAVQLRRERAVDRSAVRRNSTDDLVASTHAWTARALAGAVMAAVVIAALTLVALAGTPAGPQGVQAPGGTLPAFNSPDHSGH